MEFLATNWGMIGIVSLIALYAGLDVAVMIGNIEKQLSRGGYTTDPDAAAFSLAVSAMVLALLAGVVLLLTAITGFVAARVVQISSP